MKKASLFFRYRFDKIYIKTKKINMRLHISACTHSLSRESTQFYASVFIEVDCYGFFRADADYKESRRLKTGTCEGY